MRSLPRTLHTLLVEPLLLLLCWSGFQGAGLGQTPSGSAAVAGSVAAIPQPRTVHGRVVNAITGAGIPRALVTLNARRVLTDFQGHFEFPEFQDSQAVVAVMKPGYSQSAEPGEMYVQQRIADTSAAVEVKLYPNAVITGTVAGTDGLPLSQIAIRVLRANYDMSGLRWVDAGFAMTSSRGEYRFLIPAGRYRLAVGYSPRSRDVQGALLPLRVPSDSSSNGSMSWIALSPGEEKQIDLRPRTAATHPVLIRVDQPGGRQNLRMTAVTGGGEVFNINYSAGTTPGEYRTELPAGSYTIHAQSETREESLHGMGRVTVADGDVPTAIIHLAPAASLSIEVSGDSASVPNANINVAQLGLTLHEVAGSADSPNPDIPPRAREDRTFEFRVPPGRYRLTGYGGGSWYVESATYGGITNLLTSDLVIAAGSAGEPIRLVVGNVRGNVRGQVALPDGVLTAWVYAFPRQPMLMVPNPQPTGSDGSFVVGLPAGSYAVAAFAHRLQEDLKDAETVERLSAGAPTVEVTSGTNPAINLTLSRVAEAPR